MDKKLSVASLLAGMDANCPSGFAIALHIEFTSPTFLFQTYPKQWIDIYTKRGLVLNDPTVRWGFENTGTIRWRNLVDQDDANVMQMAHEFGLNYGFTAALVSEGSRTVASFARSDRDYLDAEINELRDQLRTLHNETQGLDALSESDLQALRKMSIRLTHA